MDLFHLSFLRTPTGRPFLVKGGSGESRFGENGGPGREKIEVRKWRRLIWKTTLFRNLQQQKVEENKKRLEFYRGNPYMGSKSESRKHAPVSNNMRFLYHYCVLRAFISFYEKWRKTHNKKTQCRTQMSFCSTFLLRGLPGRTQWTSWRGRFWGLFAIAFAVLFQAPFGTPTLASREAQWGANILFYFHKSNNFKEGPGAPKTRTWTARRASGDTFGSDFGQGFYKERPQTRILTFFVIFRTNKKRGKREQTQKTTTNTQHFHGMFWCFHTSPKPKMSFSAVHLWPQRCSKEGSILASFWKRKTPDDRVILWSPPVSYFGSDLASSKLPKYGFAWENYVYWRSTFPRPRHSEVEFGSQNASQMEPYWVPKSSKQLSNNQRNEQISKKDPKNTQYRS